MASACRRTFLSVFVLAALGAALIPSGDAPCAATGETSRAASVQTPSWLLLTPFAYAHDGAPLETERFVIYSDLASPRKKEFVAGQAESALADVLQQLGIETMDPLLFRPGTSKIDLFLLEGATPDWGGWAYYGGFLLSPNACTSVYCRLGTIKHELMHVVGFLLAGFGSMRAMQVDVWFDEGLAEYVAGSRAIGSLDEYEARREELEDVIRNSNPVSVHEWSDLGTSATGTLGVHAYELFELAVRYLMDEDGLGRTLEDAKALYLDLREGLAFRSAFLRRFGLRLVTYEVQFDALMREYLP